MTRIVGHFALTLSQRERGPEVDLTRKFYVP